MADSLIFPAPKATYNRETFKKYLCWIPWNEAISPDKCAEERYAEGIPTLWFPAPRAAGVMIFFHGNAEDLGMAFGFLRHMRDQFKVNVLACEYPGYGLLGHAPPCEDALKEVVLTAFRFVVDELKVAYQQVILFGRSIGSGPAVYLASRFPVGGLILVAAFASVKEVIRTLVGKMVAWAFTERFPNLALIGNVSCPTLFIHGERDSLVPASQTVALFRRCRARKLLITPPNMEHNTNLFTDASFLAIPAINFFGLPGYQRDRPPQMPTSFYEDGRSRWAEAQALKKHSKNKSLAKDPASTQMSPWFFFCGCPTNKRTGKGENGTDIIALRPSGEEGARSQSMARDKLLDELLRHGEILSEGDDNPNFSLRGDHKSTSGSGGCRHSAPIEDLSWVSPTVPEAKDDGGPVQEQLTRLSEAPGAKSEAPVIRDEGPFEVDNQSQGQRKNSL